MNFEENQFSFRYCYYMRGVKLGEDGGQNFNDSTTIELQ